MKILPFIFLMLSPVCVAQMTKSADRSFRNCASRADARPYEIVINEIMADPAPSAGLPPVEYLELYNKTGVQVEMEGWKLSVGGKSKALPACRLEKQGYLLLCEARDSALLKPYGSVLPVKGLPALPNEGGILTLTGPSGEIMHSVPYSGRWFSNVLKAEGGWSLELKDPDNPCGGYGNWDGSENTLGGTPGYVNSQACRNPDLIRPDLFRAATVSDSGLLVTFSESMMFSAMADPFLYTVNRGFFHPLAAEPVPPDYASVNLTFQGKFEPYTLYELMVKEEICDCAGNSLAGRYTDFGLASSPDSLDLIINEVLFDACGEEEFVEIMNRSEKVIELSSLKLILTDLYAGDNLKLLAEITGPFQLMPGRYAVVTRNAGALMDHYRCRHPAAIIEDQGMAALPDKEGTIALAGKTFRVIDQFTYSAAYHHALVRNPEGVSLERLHCGYPSNDPANWHSAAENAGFATPGYENSQTLPNARLLSSPVSVSPEVFTPDNDGNDDFIALSYQFDQAGLSATVMIFDSRGRMVRQLANNKVLGNQGTFTWDGTNGEGRPERAGMYLFYLEVFSGQGGVQRFKNTCILARKLH